MTHDESTDETGRTVLVTGAGGGIGRAVAVELAGRGHGLALVDRDTDGLAETLDAVRAHDVVASAHEVDVSDGAQVRASVAAIDDERPLTGLANVAGVMGAGEVCPPEGPGLDEDAWHRAFAVNSTGVFLVSQAAGARMAGRGDGAVVTVASNAAGVPRAGMAAYAASKAAARSFTHSLGLELGPRGVRCNVLAPGSTETPMLHGLWHDESGRRGTVEGDSTRFRAGIPLGRTARPEDIAPGVAFLLSDEARHVTLATLLVDGGAALGVS